MDKELSKKIAEAIKGKLKELEGYVADGLADYVMVMVANKKTRVQIEDDLQLFLGKNAGEFSAWLVKLLQKIKYNDCQKNEEKVAESKLVVNLEAEDNHLDEDVLALTAQEQETDELIEKDDAELSLSSEIVQEPVSNSKPKSSTPEPNLTSDTKQHALKPLKNEHVSTPASGEPKAVPIKEDEDEYDPLYPSLACSSAIASSVTVADRKSSVPLNRQAPKVLLLKAVHEANASIVGKDKMNHIYKPTPIKVLVAKNRKKTKPNHDLQRDWEPMEVDEDVVFKNEAFWCEKNSVKKSFNNLLYPPVVDTYSQSTADGFLSRREVLFNNSCEEAEFSFENNDGLSESGDIGQFCSRPNSPHFVVTLDGVNPDNFKKKRTLSDSFSDKSVQEESDMELSAPSKKQKLLEKCRFWPACKNSDDCDYFHPTTTCTLFPNCKFGDKCYYIHPNCKFDSRCTRKDCPYTHVNKRDFLQVQVNSNFQTLAPKPRKSTAPICKFYPNCSRSNFSCPYLHPNKKCRFGSECQSTKCPYLHQNFPARKQLKWTASSYSP